MTYSRGLLSLIAGGAMAMFAVAATAQDMTKITIGTSSDSLPASGARFARELGLFEKHGLDAEITPMESGAVATLALLSGSVQFASSGPTDVILSRARGQDIVEIASVYRGMAGTLVLRKDVAERLGVDPATASVEDRFKALDGLTIATPSATSTYTITLKAAESAGAKINYSYMAQPAMIAALETGAIDGFQASAPNWTLPVARGTAVVWVSGPRGDYPQQFVPVNSVTVHTSGDYARENPEVIAKLRAVFADLATAFEDRPDEVKAAIKKLFPTLEDDIINTFYDVEKPAFAGVQPISAEDMAHEMSYLTAGGSMPPGVTLDPAEMVAP